MVLTGILYLVTAIFLYIFPGWALLSLFWKEEALSFWEKAGLSTGLSMALYPILFLYFYVMKISPGPFLSWGLGTTAFLFLLWKNKKKIKFFSNWKSNLKKWNFPKINAVDVFILIVFGSIFFTRLAVIQDLVAPSWGDSVHHTSIVQLIRDHGGLFQSWAPYAPMESFTYHFGFHTAAAVWAWITGQSTLQAVLTAGQIFNVLAVLAFYPLVVRLCGSRWAGLSALLFAGLIFTFPGYYSNWGRYTQLAGLIILPVVILFFDVVWKKYSKRDMGTYVLISILLMGLALTHYRVVLVGIAAAFAWMFWGLWQMRNRISEWFFCTLKFFTAGIVSFAAILPWILFVAKGNLFSLFSLTENSAETSYLSQDFWIWKNTDLYFSDVYLILGGIAVVLVFLGRRRLAWPLFGWCIFSFMMANPFLLGLPGSVWLENPVLLFGLYIPFGLVFGWTFGTALKLLYKKPAGLVMISLFFCLILGLGINSQLKIINPTFQMVTETDQSVFKWIRKNTPQDSKFLVNGFLAYNGKIAVGSDAGWWLPFYTQRANTIPPINYFQEKMPSEINNDSLIRIIKSIKVSGGDAEILREVLFQHGITHVFLGEKRGRVGNGDTELISESWLEDSADFTLLYEEEKAQVWSFNGFSNDNF